MYIKTLKMVDCTYFAIDFFQLTIIRDVNAKQKKLKLAPNSVHFICKLREPPVLKAGHCWEASEKHLLTSHSYHAGNCFAKLVSEPQFSIGLLKNDIKTLNRIWAVLQTYCVPFSVPGLSWTQRAACGAMFPHLCF